MDNIFESSLELLSLMISNIAIENIKKYLKVKVNPDSISKPVENYFKKIKEEMKELKM